MEPATNSESLTKDMRIDVLPYLDGDGSLIQYLPELEDYQSFVDYIEHPLHGLPANKVIAYIILLYSSDSILNGHPMPDLKERMERAAELSGFPKSKKGFRQEVNDILFTLEDEDHRLLNMVFEYLVKQNNLEWEEIVATERHRMNCIHSLMDANRNDPKSLKDKKDLRNEIASMTSELKRKYSDLFEKNEDLIAKGRELVTRDFIEDRAV